MKSVRGLSKSRHVPEKDTQRGDVVPCLYCELKYVEHKHTPCQVITYTPYTTQLIMRLRHSAFKVSFYVLHNYVPGGVPFHKNGCRCTLHQQQQNKGIRSSHTGQV